MCYTGKYYQSFVNRRRAVYVRLSASRVLGVTSKICSFLLLSLFSVSLAGFLFVCVFLCVVGWLLLVLLLFVFVASHTLTRVHDWYAEKKQTSSVFLFLQHKNLQLIPIKMLKMTDWGCFWSVLWNEEDRLLLISNGVTERCNFLFYNQTDMSKLVFVGMEQDNDNNRTERCNSRFYAISSLRRILSGPGAIVCKSRATHQVLIMCNMWYVPRGTKGQLSY